MICIAVAIGLSCFSVHQDSFQRIGDIRNQVFVVHRICKLQICRRAVFAESARIRDVRSVFSSQSCPDYRKYDRLIAVVDIFMFCNLLILVVKSLKGYNRLPGVDFASLQAEGDIHCPF